MKKNLIFSLIPLFLFFLAGEIFCRVKLYLSHNETYYLTAPFFTTKLKENEQLQVQSRAEVVYRFHVTHFFQTEKSLKWKDTWTKWHRRGDNWYYKLKPGKYPPPAIYNYDFFTINSKGFRGNEFEEKKSNRNRLRIFTIGESSTIGMESSDTDTWPAKLQYQSDKMGKNYEIINAGMGGYRSLNYLNLIRHELINYSPDIFIVYSGFNDITKKDATRLKNEYNLALQKIHVFLYYKSMLYTVALEKVSAIKSLDPVPFLFYDTADDDSTGMEEFEKNILEIVRISKEKGIKIIFVRQMVHVPAELCLSEEPTMDEVKSAYKNNLQDKNGVRHHYCPVKLSNKFNWLGI